MNRTTVAAALATFACGLVAAPLVASHAATAPAAARAPAANSAEVVRIRQAGLKEMGTAFKNVMDGLRGGEPQTILIQQSARTIKNDAVALRGWFPAGSGPQPGLKTSAKPEIWTKPAEFRAAQDGLVRAAETFQGAAMSGNVDAMRAAARGLGGACKTCHDQFRVPDQH